MADIGAVQPDFVLAQQYLDKAREAYTRGDLNEYRAACYMLRLALNDIHEQNPYNRSC